MLKKGLLFMIMEEKTMKNLTGLAILLLVLGLLVGGLIGGLAFSKTITKTEIEKVPVEKLVEKQVPVNYKSEVVDALLVELDRDKDYRECEDDRYKAEEIVLKKVYDGFVLEENSDGDQEISEVQIKLNYDDGKCYRTFTCGLNSEQELVC